MAVILTKGGLVSVGTPSQQASSILKKKKPVTQPTKTKITFKKSSGSKKSNTPKPTPQTTKEEVKTLKVTTNQKDISALVQEKREKDYIAQKQTLRSSKVDGYNVEYLPRSSTPANVKSGGVPRPSQRPKKITGFARVEGQVREKITEPLIFRPIEKATGGDIRSTLTQLKTSKTLNVLVPATSPEFRRFTVGVISQVREKPLQTGITAGIGFGVGAITPLFPTTVKVASVGLGGTFAVTEGVRLYGAKKTGNLPEELGRTAVQVGAFGVGYKAGSSTASFIKTRGLTSRDLKGFRKLSKREEFLLGEVRKGKDFASVNIVGVKKSGRLVIRTTRTANLLESGRLTRGRVTTEYIKGGIVRTKVTQPFDIKNLKVSGAKVGRPDGLKLYVEDISSVKAQRVTTYFKKTGAVDGLILKDKPFIRQSVTAGFGRQVKDDVIFIEGFKSVGKGRGNVDIYGGKSLSFTGQRTGRGFVKVTTPKATSGLTIIRPSGAKTPSLASIQAQELKLASISSVSTAQGVKTLPSISPTINKGGQLTKLALVPSYQTQRTSSITTQKSRQLPRSATRLSLSTAQSPSQISSTRLSLSTAQVSSTSSLTRTRTEQKLSQESRTEQRLRADTVQRTVFKTVSLNAPNIRTRFNNETLTGFDYKLRPIRDSEKQSSTVTLRTPSGKRYNIRGVFGSTTQAIKGGVRAGFGTFQVLGTGSLSTPEGFIRSGTIFKKKRKKK